MGQRVAVVGAGYAGMAAAVTLASRGVPVTVFESGPVPGGRARRVRTEGHELDNGQHILVGAYTELFRMMGLVGVRDDALLRVPLEIRYARDFRFRSRWLPAPLGLALGLLLAKGIPFSERLGAARFMSAMHQGGFRLARDISVIELLDRFRQNGVVGHFLWRPLCVSALNTPPDLASANRFLAALRDTLGGGDGASDLLLPRVDLSRLFPEPAVDYVKAHGGEVRLRSVVENLSSLKDEFASVIVAVGPHQLKSLLPEAGEFTYQPIYTCYLQYAPEVQLPFPMLGLADGLVQWVFDRGALLGEKGRLACVISAQGDHQQMEQDELARRCHLELKKETLVKGETLWTRIIAEKRATITCAIGLQPVKTDYGQIHLAGDYTDPEYPPTLEAAVRSGVRAALEVAK